MKAPLRKELRAARRALPPKVHALRSTRAAAAVMRIAAFKAGARIAVYLPFDRETDTARLLAAARRRGVRLYVPVITDRRHRRMRFHRLDAATRPGTYGIRVPRHAPHGRRRDLPARWLDLIVVPVVGIDDQGRRLGMGGGFYDRALEFRRARRCWMGPRLVGLAFDCQRVRRVGADPWDVRLDAAATESGLEHFTKATR